MVCTERASKAKESSSHPEAEKKEREVEDGETDGFLEQFVPESRALRDQK